LYDFSLSDEEILVRDTARRFAKAELEPRMRAHEKARGVDAEVGRRYAATGLDALELPADLDGQGLGAIGKAHVLEELEAADPGAAIALDGLGPALYGLLEGGHAKLVEAFRGRRGVVVEDCDGRFRVDGSRLTGDQPWVPADRPAVAVLLREGRGWVVTEGLHAEPVSVCGLEAAGAARLRLDGAPLAAVIDDAAGLARARARIRVWVAALLVGAARGAHLYSLRYATERTAFGRPIAHHQAIAFLIADMGTAVAAARALLWRAAAAIDRGESAEWEAATALAEAAEQALFVGPNGVQILGGHGFMKDHPVEKWMRDIRTLAQIAGGRDEAELAAARMVAEHGMDLR